MPVASYLMNFRYLYWNTRQIYKVGKSFLKCTDSKHPVPQPNIPHSSVCIRVKLQNGMTMTMVCPLTYTYLGDAIGGWQFVEEGVLLHSTRAV